MSSLVWNEVSLNVEVDNIAVRTYAGAMLIFSVLFQIDQVPEGERQLFANWLCPVGKSMGAGGGPSGVLNVVYGYAFQPCVQG